MGGVAAGCPIGDSGSPSSANATDPLQKIASSSIAMRPTIDGILVSIDVILNLTSELLGANNV